MPQEEELLDDELLDEADEEVEEAEPEAEAEAPPASLEDAKAVVAQMQLKALLDAGVPRADIEFVTDARGRLIEARRIEL